jgi:methylated-DNA-protein-cysteine methyltransferase related protein
VEPDRTRVRVEPDRTRVRVEPDRTRAILDRVKSTPVGFVRTYGDISPGAPRIGGAVLHDCHDPDVPWHRIVRADGSLAKGARQRSLLEVEGVPFRGARVDMRVARLPDV